MNTGSSFGAYVVIMSVIVKNQRTDPNHSSTGESVAEETTKGVLQ